MLGVAAAYTYPKCGTEDARKSAGGFCWKNAYGRTAGSLPKNFGRPADCPAGYTNIGLICAVNRYNRKTVTAKCPSGMTDMGSFCRTPIGSYKISASFPSRCPAGFAPRPIVCRGKKGSQYSWFDKRGPSQRTCPAGHFKGKAGLRCYKRCKPGYTRLAFRCKRTNIRKKKVCPSGYSLGALGVKCRKTANPDTGTWGFSAAP